ncbi:hypothetical protein TNCV_815481 [Trichonephila clavipes]|nr:hypothetical protein TNCV_815481 [Trichonephila clavipes]
MRGDGSRRLVLGVYDEGHIGPGFFFKKNDFVFMTNMVSLGDKVFILQFSRIIWRCGTAGPTNSQGIVDASGTPESTGEVAGPTNSQDIVDASGTPESTGITDDPQTSLAVLPHKRTMNSLLSLIVIFFVCCAFERGEECGRSPVPKVTIAVFIFALFTRNGIRWAPPDLNSIEHLPQVFHDIQIRKVCRPGKDVKFSRTVKRSPCGMRSDSVLLEYRLECALQQEQSSRLHSLYDIAVLFQTAINVHQSRLVIKYYATPNHDSQCWTRNQFEVLCG